MALLLSLDARRTAVACLGTLAGLTAAWALALHL